MCAAVRTPQQENDYYMYGARNIKKLTIVVSNDFDTTIDFSSHFLLCSNELKYLLSELNSPNVGDVHFVLRGRLQYLMCVLHRLCDVSLDEYSASLN